MNELSIKGLRCGKRTQSSDLKIVFYRRFRAAQANISGVVTG